MAGNFSHTYGPAFGGGVFQVASQFLGQAIINGIRKQFPDQKTQRGDAYMDGVRYLLHTNFHLIDPEEQPKIKIAYEAAIEIRSNLDTRSGSKIRRLLQARTYKCRSKQLLVVVKRASDRGMDGSLLEQIRRAMGGTGPDSPGPTGPTSDDPPAPPFNGSSVNSLDEVEMTTFRSETTGDVAISLTLRGKNGKDAISQDVMAAFPPEILADDNADQKGLSIALVPVDESSIMDGNVEVDEEPCLFHA